MHPNLTKGDEQDLTALFRQQQKTAIGVQVTGFVSLFLCYWKTSFNKYVKDNQIKGTAIIGLAPLITLGMTYFMILPAHTSYRLHGSGLVTKYGLDKLE